MVLDTDVLLNEMLYPMRQARGSKLLQAVDNNAARIFLTRNVLNEVLALPEDFGRYHDLEQAQVQAVWRDWYASRLWVVDIEPDSSDPMVQTVLSQHPADAATITLARLIAPSTLLSMDKHLRLAAVPEWRPITLAAWTLGEADGTVVGFYSVLGGGLYLSGAGVGKVFKAAGKLPAAVALALGLAVGAGAVVYLTSDRGRAVRERAARVAGGVGKVVLTQLGEAIAMRNHELARLERAAVLPLEDPPLVSRVARALAIQPGMTAAEVADVLDEPTRAMTSTVRELMGASPLFEQVRRGHWTLGPLGGER